MEKLCKFHCCILYPQAK